MSGELKKLGIQMGKLGKELPSVMTAFAKLDQECVKEGALSNKTKELIALGIRDSDKMQILYSISCC